MSLPAGDLLLDPVTWDLTTSNGDLVISSGADAVRQSLYQRLRLFKGEWFLDEDVGIPYLGKTNIDRTAILGSKFASLNMVREVFRQAILATPGIATVKSIDVSMDGTTRLCTVSFVAVQDDGSLQIVDGFQLGV